MKSYVPRLLDRYNTTIKSNMMKKYQYANVMSIPKITKIVLSMTSKKLRDDQKFIEKVKEDLWLIAGQRPCQTKAKNSIAGFNLREGMLLGCFVTLRRSMMYDFLDRFVNIALPRVRDFKGILPKQFDGRGNISMGVKEQIIFPEIDYDKVEEIRGANVTVVTTCRSDEEAKDLLLEFGFPIK
ncbi:50S ribosomal protein L5 [Candidatus Fokinia solitaria]|uniref:Large ribosomal subunit protein uL5 n=1 Tax=Candidatus Fokinia solitaria TaxID=1802984 RepID=A0A2U8BTX4_9RICK|nr:50S ribosomal protein L5 [Candidatus Fokinia solitaria]AWD33527.1 50S ribosomal protein L5 [Candidatus Fokinia solitaria]